MPKKQKAKKRKFPYAHPAKHGTLHWKKILFIVLLGAFGFVLAAAISAQYIYNRIVWEELNRQSVFQMRTLIGDAIDGLEDIKSSPDVNNRIPEVRLQLPAPTSDVRKVLYLYDKGNPAADSSEYATPISESIQITTKSLSNAGVGKLNGETDMESLFNAVPEAQACSRGFLLQFEPFESGTNSANKKLRDGRTLYIYREPVCTQYGMDELEAYLLQTESY